MKIISALLIALTVYLNARHAWSGLTMSMKPEETKMLSDIGLSHVFILPIGIVSLLICLLVVFPQTFFAGNLLSAAVILIIMALALNAHNIKTALNEIPFLLLPLMLIWVGHPLKSA